MSDSTGSAALPTEEERADDGQVNPDQMGDDQRTQASDGGATDSRARRTLGVLGVIALIVIGLDQLTKALAVANIDPRDPIQIIGDTVTLTLVRNSGAAFSMATGYTWVLTLVALVVVIGILRYASRLVSTWWIVGIALVLGGAIGNLIDRMLRSPGVLRGHVVDFVSVGWWPVFNVADSAVVCGAILLVVLSLLGFEYDGSRTGFAARNRPGAGDDDA
ncbi:signal peptidase II [Gordonia amarae]|uniref:Lipoprotein signal peptidase n=2 Tax=Gordonia amarae TaxID=36821 RepID=G7GPJ9_9ACTN|nr:signal peptidase II [Gordonia amarae]GAB05524.1 lipoprotein signal peptidase [Gordonia amarae NBRC 15530]QHN18007.1 signal peptidase II [Gordonia amarae]QHN22527.1 signal peptidase II [Gordonia amarae]QHN31392.1 signal peptidase II [Gordonia amarae]